MLPGCRSRRTQPNELIAPRSAGFETLALQATKPQFRLRPKEASSCSVSVYSGSVFTAAVVSAAIAPGGALEASPGAKKPAKLKHLIFIVQENRSFDHYFGTYPGADGIPTQTPCLPSQWYPSQCFTPYPNHVDSNQGGPIVSQYQIQDVDNGKMDGFVMGASSSSARNARRRGGIATSLRDASRRRWSTTRAFARTSTASSM